MDLGVFHSCRSYSGNFGASVLASWNVYSDTDSHTDADADSYADPHTNTDADTCCSWAARNSGDLMRNCL